MSVQPLVTFIVPSIGRDTLPRALRSIDAQTDRAFLAILVMDGCEAPACAADFAWLRVINNPVRTGISNHAGAVRNLAIAEAETDWVAFLDDDDTLSPRYVEMLAAELVLAAGAPDPPPDAVVFRMMLHGGYVLPPPGAADFFEGGVGISFAARRMPVCLGGAEEFRFVPGSTEDFKALDALRRNKAAIMMSCRVAYFVRMDPADASAFESDGKTYMLFYV